MKIEIKERQKYKESFFYLKIEKCMTKSLYPDIPAVWDEKRWEKRKFVQQHTEGRIQTVSSNFRPVSVLAYSSGVMRFLICPRCPFKHEHWKTNIRIKCDSFYLHNKKLCEVNSQGKQCCTAAVFIWLLKFTTSNPKVRRLGIRLAWF